LEVEVERPTYDLTAFKVHFGLLMLKIYTKGERVLRVEATVHNAKKEFDRYGLEYYDEIAQALQQTVQRFLEVVRSVESCWLTDETLESLPEPSQVGASRLAGVDLNRSRMRAVMMAVVALSPDERGFRVEQVAQRVRETMGEAYTSRQASYDLKKLRGKGLVEKSAGTRRYLCPADGLRMIMAAAVLRERVIKPILSGSATRRRGRPPKNRDPVDLHYQAIRDAMEKLLHELGLAV
jgi:DNA-binding transcriptional ArsR family regulator